MPHPLRLGTATSRPLNSRSVTTSAFDQDPPQRDAEVGSTFRRGAGSWESDAARATVELLHVRSMRPHAPRGVRRLKIRRLSNATMRARSGLLAVSLVMLKLLRRGGAWSIGGVGVRRLLPLYPAAALSSGAFSTPRQRGLSLSAIRGAELDSSLPLFAEEKHIDKLAIAADSSTVEDWSGDVLFVPVFAEPRETSSASADAETEDDDEENGGEEEASNAARSAGFVLPDGSVAQLVDRRLEGLLSDVVDEMEWKARAGSTVWARAPRGHASKKVVLYGLGQPGDKCGAEAMQKFGAYVASFSAQQKAQKVGVVMPAVGEAGTTAEAPSQDLVMGLLGAMYKDSRFKSSKAAKKAPKLESIALLGGHEEEIQRAKAIWSGVQLAKDLVSAPANVLTPTSMAEMAASLAKELGLECEIFDKEEILKRKMGAYYGVAKGAVHPPKFIHLCYKPSGETKTKVAIVGKGLTFDSGGYNLKVGAATIELMKKDMGGSGATFGAARAIGTLKPKNVEVHFIVAACENMVSDTAMRPGDILQASNGKTIEVINTDAEGRLTLADALVFAEGLEVDRIVDLATLTGACTIALGTQYAGFWASSEDIASEVMGAAKSAGEKLWRLPLAPEYEADIKSKIADLKNVGGRGGGAITAALFLKEFVKTTPWAHFDFSGPVWNGKTGSGSGYGVKLLVRWVEDLSK
eukprot:scaffold442_cov268-Pinguiococcus_pyrenoidosus.AAC.4